MAQPTFTPTKPISPEAIEVSHKIAELRHQEALEQRVQHLQEHFEHVTDVVAANMINEWTTAEGRSERQQVAHAVADANRDRILQEKQERAAAEVAHAREVAAHVKAQKHYEEERVRK